MKKILTLIVSLLLILTTSHAYVIKMYGPECTYTMTSPENIEIILSDLKSGIRWWKVTDSIKNIIGVVDNIFTMPCDNVEIYPMYEGNQIVVQQAPNGTISPGITIATEGENYTFTITPNEGYMVEDVIVDKVSVGARTSYTFSNVNENHVITAKYSMQEEQSEPSVTWDWAVSAGETKKIEITTSSGTTIKWGTGISNTVISEAVTNQAYEVTYPTAGTYTVGIMDNVVEDLVINSENE